MWIVGVLVVVLAVVAALFAWIRSNAEPEPTPMVEQGVVEVDSASPVKRLDGGFVGTFAGEFNAGPEKRVEWSHLLCWHDRCVGVSNHRMPAL